MQGDFAILHLTASAEAESNLERTSLFIARSEDGQRALRVSPFVEQHGAEVLGAWVGDDDEYVVVRGQIDGVNAAQIADDVGMTFAGFSEIWIEDGPDLSDVEVRARLPFASLEPPERGCRICGGYDGLHFTSPPFPPLPH